MPIADKNRDFLWERTMEFATKDVLQTFGVFGAAVMRLAELSGFRRKPLPAVLAVLETLTPIAKAVKGLEPEKPRPDLILVPAKGRRNTRTKGAAQ